MNNNGGIYCSPFSVYSDVCLDMPTMPGCGEYQSLCLANAYSLAPSLLFSDLLIFFFDDVYVLLYLFVIVARW